MPLPLLPIGIQSFEKIRTGGYLYVDKTPFISSLVQKGSYYFISRPRRFGKSLFIDTLDCVFSGRRELFTGLYLDRPEAHWDFKNTYPVIRITLSQRINRTSDALNEHLSRILMQEAERFGLSLNSSLSPGFQLEDLVKGIYNQSSTQVVLLIDEYDKPILDNLEEPCSADLMRDELKSFTR